MRVSKRLIDITAIRDIVQRRIPMVSADSKVPGPVVWITACIHGDEVGGTGVVHDVFSSLRKAPLRRGVVHAFPLVNSMGFENVSRFINSDREDLNRCFPGNLRGSMGEQIAHRLLEIILKTGPDLVVDIHNDWVRSVPYVLVEPAADFPSPEVQQRTLRLARASGLFLVEDSDVLHPLHNTLAGALVATAIPAFTVEAGGAFAIVEQSVAAGRDALLSILRELEMIDPAGEAASAPNGSGLLQYTNRPLCTTSGLIRFAVEPGQQVAANQPLARVYSAFGSCEETLRATAPGFVLGLEDHARVLPGREVIAIAQQP